MAFSHDLEFAVTYAEYSELSETDKMKVRLNALAQVSSVPDFELIGSPRDYDKPATFAFEAASVIGKVNKSEGRKTINTRKAKASIRAKVVERSNRKSA